MKTVIAPTDFSPASQTSLSYAANLANFLHARLVIVHVVGIPIGTLELPACGLDFEMMEETAIKQLDESEANLDPGLRKQIVITKDLRCGQIEQQIENVADDHDSFAIVMGSYHRDPLSRAVWGSQTLRMMNYSKYSVLLVPQGFSFVPLKRIAVAWDIRTAISGPSKQYVKDWVGLFNASLEIINVYSDEFFKPEYLPALTGLRLQLLSLNPSFSFIQSSQVDETLLEQILEKKPDLFLLFPEHRHYFESLFHRKHARRLTQITRLLILSIPLEITKEMNGFSDSNSSPAEEKQSDIHPAGAVKSFTN